MIKRVCGVIIQNLVNKIWLRNDDVYTITEVVKQIGKENKKRVSINVNENSKESKYSLITKKFENFKSSINEGYSVSNVYEDTLDSSFFSMVLKTFECSCLLSDGINMNFYKRVKTNIWKG